MTQSTVPDDPFIGVAPTADPEALAPLVSNWLPDQRFFAGKSRAVESLRCRLLGRVGRTDFHVQLWLASVDYVDGGRELYQVPLFFTPDAQEMYSHAHLGEVRVGERHLHVYDAMVGRNLPQAFITALAGAPQEPSAPAAGQPADEVPAAANVAGVSPGLDFHRIVAAADLPLGAPSRALT
ncbi:MAG: maltokinase N-terminal cap-like domain-containing protein, partial [Janthinobacterium lividum]